MELDITSAIKKRSAQQKKEIEEKKKVLSELLMSFTFSQRVMSFSERDVIREARVYPSYDRTSHLTRIEFTLLGSDLVRHILQNDDANYSKMVELLYHKNQFDEFIQYLTHTMLPGVLNETINLDREASIYDFYIKRNLQ